MEENYYIGGDGTKYPDRRQSWDKCGHHEGLERKIDLIDGKYADLSTEMRASFRSIEKEIENIKIENTEIRASHEQQFKMLFRTMQEVKDTNGKIFIMVGGVLLTLLASIFLYLIQTAGTGGVAL